MRPVLILVSAGLILSGCGGAAQQEQLPAAASASHGKALIAYYGCGACHVIGGIETANGHVGPPLTSFRRRYPQIAGVMPNTPRNLVHWITNPQHYVPKGDMPDLGIGPHGALDIAAYLYSQ